MASATTAICSHPAVRLRTAESHTAAASPPVWRCVKMSMGRDMTAQAQTVPACPMGRLESSATSTAKCANLCMTLELLHRQTPAIDASPGTIVLHDLLSQCDGVAHSEVVVWLQDAGDAPVAPAAAAAAATAAATLPPEAMGIAAAATATVAAAAEPMRQAAVAAAAAAQRHGQQPPSTAQAAAHAAEAASLKADAINNDTSGPELHEQHIAVDRSGLAGVQPHSHGPPAPHKQTETAMVRHLKALIQVRPQCATTSGVGRSHLALEIYLFTKCSS